MRVGAHGVVVGGSITGLVAARALASQVMHLTERPSALFHPRILFRAMTLAPEPRLG